MRKFAAVCCIDADIGEYFQIIRSTSQNLYCHLRSMTQFYRILNRIYIDLGCSKAVLLERSPLTTIETSNFWVDWINREGNVTAINDTERHALGLSGDMLGSVHLEEIYTSETAHLLRSIARDEVQVEEPLTVWVKTTNYIETPMLATLVHSAELGMAVVKQALSATVLDIGPELIERIEILSQMIGAATEACWCIEFLEPIDTSLSEEEIVGQVFTSQSRWRACNEAMAKLYRVPEGLDFNTQPVSRYFPDTEVNRNMIRELVRANYRLDHAAAVDRRHDGSEIVVENDFRAGIKDGLLVRLWGTTRDIGPYRQREQQLSDRADSMLDILSATPDPIIVISDEGTVMAANPATEVAWGRPAEKILGRSIDLLIETKNATEKLRNAAFSDLDSELELNVHCANGEKEIWRFRSALMGGESRRYVLTARRKTRRKSRRLAEEAA